MLPEHLRRAMHEGVLANDVVGFHTRALAAQLPALRARTFSAPTVDIDASTVTHDGRTTLVTSHPIGVDPAEFDELRDDAGRARAGAGDRRAPAGVSRRARRPHRSVEEHRARLSRVRALPRHASRDARARDDARAARPVAAGRPGVLRVPRGDRSARRARVNDRFQREGWLPIDLQIADNFAQSVAAYKQYDALLVNAVFDGLNLVSKEAPLVNERDGVLILSENAGSHEELGEWALTVNPFDVYGQAQAINAALTMPADERRRRLEAIRAHVREHDLAAWIAAQLADLDRVAARSR